MRNLRPIYAAQGAGRELYRRGEPLPPLTRGKSGEEAAAARGRHAGWLREQRLRTAGKEQRLVPYVFSQEEEGAALARLAGLPAYYWGEPDIARHERDERCWRPEDDLVTPGDWDHYDQQQRQREVAYRAESGRRYL